MRCMNTLGKFHSCNMLMNKDSIWKRPVSAVTPVTHGNTRSMHASKRFRVVNNVVQP